MVEPHDPPQGAGVLERAPARGVALLVLLGLAPTLVAAALWRTPRAPHAAVPTRHQDGGYIGSGACKSCHAAEHASWSGTFHSTMTRVASEESFAPRLPAELALDERSYELSRSERGTVLVAGPDVHRMAAVLRAVTQRSDVSRASLDRALADVPRVTREVVMVTGSHHYQAFWVEDGPGTELRQLPFVYLLDDELPESERWLPRRDAFLQPPDALPHVARWNGNCVQCHSVAGRPGESTRPATSNAAATSHFDTSAAELGIACEACHGPGADHAAHYRSPLARYLGRGVAQLIVNPARLDADAGSAVCGQCHSYFVPHDEDEWWKNGFSNTYRAGEPLAPSRLVLDPARHRTEDALLSRSMDSVFWPDGTIRVGGREYNGLVQSPCFEHGQGERKLACTSCHSMHDSPPDDQLARGMDGNRACTQCHQSFERDVTAHTHHAANSSGSDCMSCHMPKTTYALLKSIRSHRVTSPEPQSFEADGPTDDAPNACNLCHLDRTLAWSAEWMTRFWGTPQQEAQSARAAPSEAARTSELAPPAWLEETPASVAWLLAGNAAQRVLLADAFAWDPAREVSGTAWARPALAHLSNDPYAAVRFVAQRSLRALETRPRANPLGRNGRATTPRLTPEQLEALTTLRDDRPITISE